MDRLVPDDAKKIKSLKWFLNRFTKIKKIFHAPSEKRQQKPCVDAAEEAAAAAAAFVLPPRQPLPLFGVYYIEDYHLKT